MLYTHHYAVLNPRASTCLLELFTRPCLGFILFIRYERLYLSGLGRRVGTSCTRITKHRQMKVFADENITTYDKKKKRNILYNNTRYIYYFFCLIYWRMPLHILKIRREIRHVIAHCAIGFANKKRSRIIWTRVGVFS